MKKKKYELIKEETTYIEGHVLYRIKALRDIPSIGVKAGDKGGFVESEDNLSQEGNSWVGGEACAYGRTRVYDDGIVLDHARVKDSTVFENGVVEKYAVVEGDSYVFGRAVVTDHTKVIRNSWVFGNETKVCGYDWVKGNRCD